MGSTRCNPVLRHDLRVEARKHIGNLGLLDHLLKHMVGMVVADGKERFLRRHNSDGAIEYWLEPVDLTQMRRKAGSNDPCWVPPPGWKSGNAGSKCTCHGHCKKIASQLEAEVNVLRRYVVVFLARSYILNLTQTETHLEIGIFMIIVGLKFFLLRLVKLRN